jgi:hypothetical protein
MNMAGTNLGMLAQLCGEGYVIGLIVMILVVVVTSRR